MDPTTFQQVWRLTVTKIPDVMKSKSDFERGVFLLQQLRAENRLLFLRVSVEYQGGELAAQVWDRRSPFSGEVLDSFRLAESVKDGRRINNTV